MSKVKYGIIGLGWFGEYHGDALAGALDVDVGLQRHLLVVHAGHHPNKPGVGLSSVGDAVRLFEARASGITRQSTG